MAILTRFFFFPFLGEAFHSLFFLFVVDFASVQLNDWLRSCHPFDRSSFSPLPKSFPADEASGNRGDRPLVKGGTSISSSMSRAESQHWVFTQYSLTLRSYPLSCSVWNQPSWKSWCQRDLDWRFVQRLGAGKPSPEKSAVWCPTSGGGSGEEQ